MGVCHHGTLKSFSSPQVLSHNLYTVLNIPHDPVALEEHFQDDDDGPVSNHGYMPYLNKYILNKVHKVALKFGVTVTPDRCFQSGLISDLLNAFYDLNCCSGPELTVLKKYLADFKRWGYCGAKILPQMRIFDCFTAKITK